MRFLPVILFALFAVLAFDAVNGAADAACRRGAAGCGLGYHGVGVGARGVGVRAGTPMNRGGPVNRVGRR